MEYLSKNLKLWKKIRELFDFPFSRLEPSDLMDLIEAELDYIEKEIQKILKKHGVEHIISIDNFFRCGKIREAKAWNDYLKLDLLEYKRKLLQRSLHILLDLK